MIALTDDYVLSTIAKRKIATESSGELDGTEWYDRICSCLYFPPSRKGAV